MKPTTKAILALAWAFALGCGDDDSKIGLPSDMNGAAAIGGGDQGMDAMVPVASCDGAADGTPCGKPGEQMHCIFDACRPNACGDGLKAYGEECDDDNERDGDGCSSRCVKEAGGTSGGTGGMSSGTGGTSSGTGGASGTSSGTGGTGGTGGTSGGTGGTSSGTGGTSGGTGGTSGGTGGTSGGTGGMGDDDGGMPDGGTGGNPGCDTCREANCHAYYSGSMDALAGCFDPGANGATARAAWASAVFSPTQVQTCVDAVACAEMKACGHDPGRPAAACYCGALYTDNGECAAAVSGAPNGVCKAEFEAATEETAPMNVMTALSSAEVPAGWAYFLLECETNFCATDCGP